MIANYATFTAVATTVSGAINLGTITQNIVTAETALLAVVAPGAPTAMGTDTAIVSPLRTADGAQAAQETAADARTLARRNAAMTAWNGYRALSTNATVQAHAVGLVKHQDVITMIGADTTAGRAAAGAALSTRTAAVTNVETLIGTMTTAVAGGGTAVTNATITTAVGTALLNAWNADRQLQNLGGTNDNTFVAGRAAIATHTTAPWTYVAAAVTAIQLVESTTTAWNGGTDAAARLALAGAANTAWTAAGSFEFRTGQALNLQTYSTVALQHGGTRPLAIT
jgi:hypothetical protein